MWTYFRLSRGFLARAAGRVVFFFAACLASTGFVACAPGPSQGSYLIALLGAVSLPALENPGQSSTLCQQSLLEIIQPARWSELQAVLQAEAAKGVSGPPTADRTTITGVTGLYAGGVLAPNGKIYGIPFSGGSVLIIDPETDTADTTTISGLSSATYVGGVLAPNGKIYAIPYFATSLLVIDPATDTATQIPVPGWAAAPKWAGGVLAPNGKIYGIPYNDTSVLIIDPETDTADTATITGLVGGTKWYGAGLAPNGNIYGSARNATTFLKIDPVAGTTATIVGAGIGGGKFSGLTLADNGMLYTTHHFTNSIRRIDPTIDTQFDVVGGFSATNPNSVGSVRSVDGKIYNILQTHGAVTILDPGTGTIDQTSITGLPGNSKWAGGILAPNGKIYGMPYFSGTVLILDTKANGSLCPAILQSAYFNKL